VGVRDTRPADPGEPGAVVGDEAARIAPRRTLRAAVHHSLLHCGALRALLAHHGCVLAGGVSGTEPTSQVETLEARSALHGNSLDPPHLLVLAHVLRRPVVCYASAAVGEVREVDSGRTFSSYAAKGERMSGIYLPSLLSPDETSRDPIVLAYTPGHFTVLVNSEAASDAAVWSALGLTPPAPAAAPVPLADETCTPLPVLFPPLPHAAGAAPLDETTLCARYLRMHAATLSTTKGDVVDVKTLPLTAQRVPPRERASAPDIGLADEFYESVWARRLAAAQEPLPSDTREAPARSYSFGREDSEAQMAAAIAASLVDQQGGGSS
jgi:hypothetical protein